MAGPWEKYQTQDAAPGPWTKYQAPPSEPTPEAPEPSTSISGLAASIGRGAAPIAAGAGVGAMLGGPPGAAVGAGAMGLTEMALGLYNPIADRLGLPKAITPQEATDKLLDLAGVKRPSTGLERGAQAAAGAASGAGGMAAGAGEVAGSVAGPLVKRIAGKMAERPVAQAVSGAASGLGAQGAAEAGAGPMGQLAAGMAAGLVPGAAGKVAGPVVAPKISPKAQQLLDAGVELTPGQLGGTIPKRAEEAAKSIPVTGSMVRSAEGRAIDSFNVATANKALEPIGVRVPPGVTGRDLIKFGQAELGAAYDDVLSKVTFKADAAFDADVKNLRRMVATLPQDKQDQFERIYEYNLQQRLDPTGTMLGVNLKIVNSELTQLASEYKGSAMAGERQLGHAIDALNDHVREALRRQNPNWQNRLDDIDRGYAMFVRLDRAANASAVNAGRFTPGQLLQAIKAEEASVRKRAFARGDSLLQDWGQTAYDVMGNRMPDSGTPERMMWDIGGAAGLGLFDPKLLAAMGATAIPYTRPGEAAVRAFAQPGPTRQAARAALSGPLPIVPLATGPFSTVNPVDAMPRNQ